MATIYPFKSQGAAVDVIDMELAEIGALITGLRFLWENAEPEQLASLRDTSVALAYIAHDKIERALARVPQAYGKG